MCVARDERCARSALRFDRSASGRCVERSQHALKSFATCAGRRISEEVFHRGSICDTQCRRVGRHDVGFTPTRSQFAFVVGSRTSPGGINARRPKPRSRSPFAVWAPPRVAPPTTVAR